MMSSDERHVIDYFIVAGLPDNPVLLRDCPQKASHEKRPIIEIVIINKTQGESPPEEYECVEYTPSGYPANLNHGSVLAQELYLCYKRGWNKPPIIDLGVMYSGKELPKVGCKVLTHTPYGKSANVNNTGGEKIYITYVRADEEADSNTLVVVDICVILPGKNEVPPHAFRKIDKNLNKGMLGSDVFLCYKKSIVKNNSLNCEAAILFRYPAEDLPDFPLPQQVAMFCLPFGATIESWPPGSRHALPLFSTFVLTGATGEKVYGAAVIFYEEFDETKLDTKQKTKLGLKPPKKHHTMHQNQSICILSRWPFFDTFKKFLLCLYRISVSGPQQLPLERHIGHFMSEVPFPSRERPRILVQLSTESVTLLLPEETPLPQSGASFIKMLMNLGPDNIISVLFYVLLEHRILIHSVRPDLLTSVAEAVVSMIFPFRWQCPYIPLCPLQLSGLLDSPTPFIIGLDSRYFDLLDPPSDITFVDLDTCTITVSEERKEHGVNLLPKRQVKVLRSTLEELYEQFIGDSSNPSTPDELDRHGVLSVHAFRGKRKLEMLEMSIQEAFLRFMAGILKDYDKFLLPVVRNPGDTDVDAAALDKLFNIPGFVNSREKPSRNFFREMIRTQYFSRFIDERSFVSDENIGLAFFDECIHRLDAKQDATIPLLDFEDISLSERTVFVLPPEPPTSSTEIMYSYKGFAHLQLDLFAQQSKKEEVAKGGSTNLSAGSISRRTKQELKSFQKALIQYADQAEPVAKCFIWICYSLWFICLPYHILNSSYKIKSLEDALETLRQMHKLQMQPLDEACYRILMCLCCIYNQPVLAVKIFHEMKENHIHPNAITYGFYNKAIVESKWPSSVTKSAQAWKKLRNIIFATVQLRHLYKERKQQKSTADTKGNLEEERMQLAQTGGETVAQTDEELPANADTVQKRNLKQDDCDPSISTNKSARISVLTSVTENDPLGLFITQSNVPNNVSSNSNSHQSKVGEVSRKLSSSCTAGVSKNSDAGHDVMSSKSKSIDELNDTTVFESPQRPSTKLRRRGSFESKDKTAASEIPDTHSRTLPRVQKLKMDDAKQSLPRTGSFGSAWHSAVTLVSSTYHSLRDSLSAGTSAQNIGNEVSVVNNSGFLMPLQTEQRAHSAGDLVFDGKKIKLERDQRHGSLTTESGSSTGHDSTDLHASGLVSDAFISDNAPVSVEVDLCTQSKCPNCANLLHDEEIMAGWSLNESNLQSRCLCCGYNFVPKIHITLRDFRCTGRPGSVAVSSEKDSALESDSLESIVRDSMISGHSERWSAVSEESGFSNSNSLPSVESSVTDGNSLGRISDSKVKRKMFTLGDGSDMEQMAFGFKNSTAGIPLRLPSSFYEVKTEDALNRQACKEESFTVPYLSPLVLKKEMENLLELHGEDRLNRTTFIKDHDIIYWNLVWFFKRIHQPSHLYSLILNLSIFDNNKTELEGLALERNQNVVVRTLWNGSYMHKEYGLPMYILWRNSKMAVPESDEVMVFSERFLKRILSYIKQYEIQEAIELVLSERKSIPRKGKVLYRSIYYDVLFLAISVFGSNFKIEKYDTLYREACNDLSPAFSARLMEADRPPRMSTICCRKQFYLLEL